MRFLWINISEAHIKAGEIKTFSLLQKLLLKWNYFFISRSVVSKFDLNHYRTHFVSKKVSGFHAEKAFKLSLLLSLFYIVYHQSFGVQYNADMQKNVFFLLRPFWMRQRNTTYRSNPFVLRSTGLNKKKLYQKLDLIHGHKQQWFSRYRYKILPPQKYFISSNFQLDCWGRKGKRKKMRFRTL